MVKKTLIYIFSLIVVVALGLSVAAFCREGNYKDRLWAHRVNSLEKRGEFHDLYPNFEVDVTIRQDSLNGSIKLDVTHDEDVTFGLSFDEYIPALKKGEKVWVDIKNLSPNNNTQFLEKLNSFVSNYEVEKESFIIETRDYEALRLLTENGYYTSYYVDFENIDDNVVRHLDEVAQSGCVRALSFPSKQYVDIRNHVKDKNIDFLTWAHRETQFEFLLNPFNQKMLDDERLKVILIKTRGHYHR